MPNLVDFISEEIDWTQVQYFPYREAHVRPFFEVKITDYEEFREIIEDICSNAGCKMDNHICFRIPTGEGYIGMEISDNMIKFGLLKIGYC